MLLPSKLGLLLAIVLLTTPALAAAEEKTETIHGTCISGSHASLRKPGNGISRPFPVYCDTATIATSNSGTKITFAGKTARRPVIFEGMQHGATLVRLNRMSLRDGEMTPISDGKCEYELVDGLVYGITCTAKVEGDKRDTVVIAFSSKYGA